MLLRIHLDIVLGEASFSVFCVERTVAAVKYVDLRVCELGIVFGIRTTILLANMASHDGCSVCRVLAVENQESPTRDARFEKLAGEHFLVIIVDSTINMATLEFVLKATINYHTLVIIAPVLTIQDV
jgi:hypothetical protein